LDLAVVLPHPMSQMTTVVLAIYTCLSTHKKLCR